jgi:hypothetical protein
MAKQESKVEIKEVVKPTAVVKVLMNGTEYEVSGDVANALIAAKRAELIK